MALTDATTMTPNDPPSSAPAPTAAPASSIKRFAPIALVVAGLGGAYALGLDRYLSLAYLAEARESLLATVENNLLVSSLTFVGLYAAAVAVSFPAASILTVFSGFLFGWMWGGALTAVAATIGATALFLAASTAFGDTLRRKAGPRVKRLAEGFEENAFSYLLALRLAPIFPFFVINIAPALFGVPLRTYVAATFLGILPGTFAYSYLGQGLDSVLAAAAETGGEVSLSSLVTPQILIAFLALGAVALIPTVVKKLRS